MPPNGQKFELIVYDPLSSHVNFISADTKEVRVNGHLITLAHRDDKLSVFKFEDSASLILDEAVWLEAVDRIEAKEDRSWNGDLLPFLQPKMSFGLRQVNAHLFGTIWSQTKHELQDRKAKDTADICFLPKEIGPCRLLDARFYFNSESGHCEPFGVS